MALKNYYAILGVSRDATPSGIRAAYKDAVRRTHPDHAGPKGAAAFQEIVEAHSVLCDPKLRREYNDSLDLHEPDRSDSVSRESSTTEAYSKHSSLESFSMEVILTPEEAARGGTLRFDIPIQELCLRCAGTGSDWVFPCIYCGGKGTFCRMRPVRLTIPHSLRLGLTPEVCLEIYNVNLRMRVSNDGLY